MSNNSNSSSSDGVGFAGLLTVAFIILKLTGHIAWSWAWVLSPLWITAILIAGIILIALAMAAYTGQLK